MAITPADLDTLVKIIKATEKATGAQVTNYTLTGASDWNMLMAVGGMAAFFLGSVVAVLIGVIWKTLPKKEDLDDIARRFSDDIMKIAARWETSLDKACNMQSETTARELGHLRDTLTECQKECYHRRKDDKACIRPITM